MAGKSEYYTYVHLRSDSGAPFYVGKGKGDRAYRSFNRNPHWQNIAAKGYEVKFLAHGIEEELAFLVEIEAIDLYRRKRYALANYTNGGEGTSGMKHSEETKRKIAASNTGKIQPPHTKEAKEKIGAASRGRKLSYETRQKQSAAATGKPKSETHKYNIAKARIGKMLSEGAKKKLSNKRWVTDGVNSYFVDKDAPLEPGTWLGRTYNRKGT